MSLLAHMAYLWINHVHEQMRINFEMTHIAEIPAEGDVVGFSYNDLAKSYSSRPPCLTAYVHQFQHNIIHTRSAPTHGDNGRPKQVSRNVRVDPSLHIVGKASLKFLDNTCMYVMSSKSRHKKMNSHRITSTGGLFDGLCTQLRDIS